MKVTPEHFAALKAAIEPLDTEELRLRYKGRNIPRAESVKDINKRYRWDLLWASRIMSEMRDAFSEYDMSHLDTALKRIVPAIEAGSEKK